MATVSGEADRHPAVKALLARLTRCIGDCARQEMGEVPTATVAALAERVVAEVREFVEGQSQHIYELVKIGLALSAEKNTDHLLEMIVSEARRFTHADGGTLYIKADERPELAFAIVQNDSLRVHMGGSGQPITWPNVPLLLPDGGANHRNVSAHCALTGEAVNIPDVYCADGYDFQGTRDFDASTGYRSRSMLVIPMRDHEDQVIGVLQLLNAQDRATNEVVPFPEHEVDMVESLASQAAIALTNMRLVRELENLMDSFVQTIGDAIDAKSPHTAGHIFRVANLTGELASEINRAQEGSFAQVQFNEEQLAEIRMAAWLHDVGKITTPEHLMDKATKLETVFDRLELVRHRVEIARLERELARLRGEAATVDCGGPGCWEELVDFLAVVNRGGEGMTDESLERLRWISGLTYRMEGAPRPLLEGDEVENLSVRRGTLTKEERELMNHHAEMTIRMLGRLPFPRKLSNVATYAGMHHEKLNGRGYPRGLTAERIPLPARMLALADVVEALTAADRPYKEGKMLSEAMAILEGMVERGELDGELCDLAVSSGLISRFARETLPDRQRDDFVWRGRRYSVAEPR
ncbi:MAG: HD domain-containing phosphohydrolase [Thermodesulfobacteriota bacterium]